MIERRNPYVGHLTEKVAREYGACQIVRADKTLYFAGVAPVKGDMESLEVVGVGDIRAQTEWTLEVIRRYLETEGATFRNWVSQTIFTTDIAAMVECIADLNRQFFGDEPPAATLVEINALFHPDVMLEISGIAVLD